MIRIEPFEPQHIEAIEVQPSQAGTAMPGEFYAAKGPAWTVFAEDGRILFCGGFMMADPGYGVAWCVMATGKGSDLVAITRAARRLIHGSSWRRVEMYSDARFDDAARWAGALGFTLEGVRRKALPDGGDMLIWARVEGD